MAKTERVYWGVELISEASLGEGVDMHIGEKRIRAYGDGVPFLTNKSQAERIAVRDCESPIKLKITIEEV